MSHPWLKLLHYSRLLLIANSIALTMTTSIVLLYKIQWQAILLVGFSTLVVYSVDNLLDWRDEAALLDDIRPYWSVFLWAYRILIPVALVAILWLAVTAPPPFAWLLLALAIGSGALIVLSKRSNGFTDRSLFYWTERLIVALSWSLNTTLVPIFYSGQSINAQTIMTVIYVWQIGWVLGVVWRYTSIIPLRENPLSVINREQQLIRWLIVFSITAIVQATVDILLGFFPYYNAIVLVVPMISVVMLLRWKAAYTHPIAYGSLFFVFSLIGMLAIVGMYVINL